MITFFADNSACAYLTLILSIPFDSAFKNTQKMMTIMTIKQPEVPKKDHFYIVHVFQAQKLRHNTKSANILAIRAPILVFNGLLDAGTVTACIHNKKLI